MLLTTTLGLIGLNTLAYEQNSLGVSATPIALDLGLFEDKRVAEYMELMEDSLNISTLFYSRVSPEIAAAIKPVKVPDEAKELIGCMLDRVDAENLNTQYENTVNQIRQFMTYIEDTPTLTIMTMESDPQFQAIQEKALGPEFEPINKIIKECGVLDMNMKLTMQTGVMEAFKLLPQD